MSNVATRSTRISTALRQAQLCERSGGDNLDQVFQTDEICCVACVEPGGVRVCGGCDQQVQRRCSRSAARLDNGSCELSVTGRNGVVDWYSVERPLEQQQTTQSFSTHILVFRDEDTKM
jgi:hypothetical protein